MSAASAPTPFTIRPIEQPDFPAVAAMLVKLAGHVRPGFVPMVDAEALARHGPTGLGQFEAMIAERDGAAIGLCLYTYAFSSWRGRPGIFVEDLYVEPTERGTGLGRALLSAIVRRESANGCTYLKLDVDKTNDGALRFYGRLGFAIADHDHTLVVEGANLEALLDPV